MGSVRHPRTACITASPWAARLASNETSPSSVLMTTMWLNDSTSATSSATSVSVLETRLVGSSATPVSMTRSASSAGSAVRTWSPSSGVG